MGLTRFPNGITVNSTTALAYSTSAGDGDVDCLDLFVAGTASVGSFAMGVIGTAGTGFVGQRAYITGTFTSAAATFVVPCPFAGNVVDVITTCDTTPRTCSAFTLQAGSAGSIGVASVALAFATAIGQQIRPTLTAFAITTASAFLAIVTTAGTAANFGYTIVLEKTA